MGLSDSSIKLMLFILVFSIVFPVFGFAMTFAFEEAETGGISQQDLMQAGIIMTDAVTDNVSRGEGWVNFELASQDYRVKWSGDNFKYQIPNQFVGWLLPTTIYEDLGYYVIIDYDTEYNWTHRIMNEGGSTEAQLLYTNYPGYDNMTQCMTLGNVTITIGRAFEQQSADLWTFAAWYFGLIFGWDTYGLPAFFVWLIRLISLIGVFSAILLAREFIPTLP